MQSFLAMLLTLRIGLVPSPVNGAVLSIRDEALAVAQNVADRDTFVARRPLEERASLTTALGSRPPPPPAWGPPPVVQMIQKEHWRDVLSKTLIGNQQIANAAMWLASAPLRLKMSHDKVFVSVALRLP